MSLSSASQLGSIIGGLANSQTQMKEDLVPDEIDQALVITPQEQLVIEDRVVVTKGLYGSTSFIIDHPVYGYVDSATLSLDGGYADSDLNTGLVAFYNFHGDATNEVSGSYNGTVSGATLTNDFEGRYYNAYSFDGVNDYISTNLANSTLGSSLTISCWVNINATQLDSGNPGIVDGMRHGILFDPVYNRLQFYTYNGSSYPSIYSSVNSVTPGTACHVIMTYNGTALSGYLNGTLVATSTQGLSTDSSLILIGETAHTSGRYLRGVIHSVGIWNRVLSATEISRLYMGGYINDYPLKSGELVTVRKS